MESCQQSFYTQENQNSSFTFKNMGLICNFQIPKPWGGQKWHQLPPPRDINMNIRIETKLSLHFCSWNQCKNDFYTSSKNWFDIWILLWTRNFFLYSITTSSSLNLAKIHMAVVCYYLHICIKFHYLPMATYYVNT